ncbi:MAG: hypothetical protein ACK521_06065 [bacterium]
MVKFISDLNKKNDEIADRPIQPVIEESPSTKMTRPRAGSYNSTEA